MAMTFETPELQVQCMANPMVMNALTAIRTGGPGHGTPGPENLDGRARHHHVTRSLGIAWYWSTAVNVHVLALGTKHNRNVGRGDSGYDWDARGRV